MGNEEVSNITSVLTVVNNFKINADHKSLPTRSGKSMYGRDKQLRTCKLNTVRARIGFVKPLMSLM